MTQSKFHRIYFTSPEPPALGTADGTPPETTYQERSFGKLSFTTKSASCTLRLNNATVSNTQNHFSTNVAMSKGTYMHVTQPGVQHSAAETVSPSTTWKTFFKKYFSPHSDLAGRNIT